MSPGGPVGSSHTYQRLRRVAGVAELPALEERIVVLEGDVLEERGLLVPLVDLVTRLETQTAALVRARAERRTVQEADEPDLSGE